MRANPVLVIAGPTASGKSRLAAEVAQALHGVVLNSDSMQIYKDIPVISAAPDENELALAEHRLFGIYDCAKRGNVVEWLNLCAAEIRSLWREKRLPVVCGGTGMYTEALIRGVTPIPEVSASVREKVRKSLNNDGLGALYEELRKKDAEIAEKLHANDRTRIVRALEIMEQTGVKVSDWYRVPLIKKLPEAGFVTVKIMPEPEIIAERCRCRLDKMMYEENALEEIRMLLQRGVPKEMPVMKALGVPELSACLRGTVAPEEALALAKLHTKQYAKRQRTWLKHRFDADIVFDCVYDGQKDYLQKIISVLNL